MCETPPDERQLLYISPALDTPLHDQALIYYSRYYVEVPHDLPEIVDSHNKYASVDWCYSQPQSILGLAISALSHATFGRGQRSHKALQVGRQDYSRALVKTNLALADPDEATRNDVFLAVILMSRYESTVMECTPQVSSRGITAMASRSFAHHDGAMAMLKLRQYARERSNSSRKLDKLIRRQLWRSVLLRSLPMPAWLRDGSQYGEYGFALELDQCMVEVANLRHEASSLPADMANFSTLDRVDLMARLRCLLTEARALDHSLSIWASRIPSEYRFHTHTVHDDESISTGNWIFEGKVHIYPTVGHAAMWDRFRTLCLVVNDIILKVLSMFDESPDADGNIFEEAARLRVRHLADNLCASIPYILGLVENRHVTGTGVTVTARIPTSLKLAVKSNSASFLCWPLSMASMLPSIPERHQSYLKTCLLNLSEIVDDAVLEKLASGFCPKSDRSSRV